MRGRIFGYEEHIFDSGISAFMLEYGCGLCFLREKSSKMTATGIVAVF